MQAPRAESLRETDSDPLTADLAELKLGSLTLTPTFAASTTAYTAATTDASNSLTATPVNTDATVTVKLGSTVVEAGSNGKYSLSWSAGENTVTVKVESGNLSKTYTLTVTKS